MAAAIPAAKCGHVDVNTWVCKICDGLACRGCAENGVDLDEDADIGAPQFGPREPWWRACAVCDEHSDNSLICEAGGCDVISCVDCGRVHFISYTSKRNSDAMRTSPVIVRPVRVSHVLAFIRVMRRRSVSIALLTGRITLHAATYARSCGAQRARELLTQLKVARSVGVRLAPSV